MMCCLWVRWSGPFCLFLTIYSRRWLVSARSLIYQLIYIDMESVHYYNYWCVLVLLILYFSIFISHPSALGIILFLLSILVASGIGILQSSWFGVGVWLVFISGLLVLFLFFCSLYRVKVVQPRASLYGSIVFCIFFNVVIGQQSGFLTQTQISVLFQGSAKVVIVWIAVVLLLIIVVVIKIRPRGGGARRECVSYNI